MELIDKNKIAEAAKEYGDKYWTQLQDYEKMSIFEAGAQFAQTELAPIFYEFKEWCDENEREIRLGNYTSDISAITTKKLFELWLEERQKESHDRTTKMG